MVGEDRPQCMMSLQSLMSPSTVDTLRVIWSKLLHSLWSQWDGWFQSRGAAAAWVSSDSGALFPLFRWLFTLVLCYYRVVCCPTLVSLAVLIGLPCIYCLFWLVLPIELGILRPIGFTECSNIALVTPERKGLLKVKVTFETQKVITTCLIYTCHWCVQKTRGAKENRIL